MLATATLISFEGCAPPTIPAWGRLGTREGQIAPAFVRRRGSRAVQESIRHALLPVFQAGCRLADDEDRDAGERAEMRAIAAGDAAAYRRLVDREAPRLLRFAQGMVGSLDEAEDVVQDTLIRLWENAARWTPDARIGTWLHRVCYNRAIDGLRRRRTFVDESVLEELADESERADAALLRNEATLSVRVAIERLPARQRTAILLFHVQGLPQREAAEVMGVSEAAFESMLSRARRQLRRWLTGEGYDD
jgi:RNA polymerase sigma-70 factor, ECF subfamily